RVADVYLNPALVDNQPLSVLEAMAAGLFVVSTEVGDVRHLIGDGRAGASVPAGSPAAMAAAASRVMHDPRRFDAATRAARAALAEHSPVQVSRRWVSCYRDALHASAGARVRRPGARLLRIQQEVAKRLDALAPPPRWQGVRDTFALLHRGVQRALPHDVTALEDVLPATFAQLAARRYPSRHLDRRYPGTAPDRNAILKEAHRICAGRWRLFGSEAALAATPNWLAHPLSGKVTPAEH